jgi:TonB family protein
MRSVNFGYANFITMCRRITIALLCLIVAIGPTLVFAGDPPASKRKIIELVRPSYPQIARTMRISGTVKLEATVGRNGKPKLVDAKGGHPTLIKAAVDAVRDWRWESGPLETIEPVEMTFTPDSQTGSTGLR